MVSFKCKMSFYRDILNRTRTHMGLRDLDKLDNLCGFPVPWRLFFICFAILL